MARFVALCSALALLVQFSQCASNATNSTISDPSSYVNVFIGTTNGGHVFPGATLPHGLIKAGMDTDSPGNQAGYDANATYNATGFSQLHDEGTGGGVSLSNFKLFPLPNCTDFRACPTSMDSRKTLRVVLPDGTPDDAGSPGYFASNLSTGIRVELTAASRAALHRYTFPASSTLPRMIVDITNDGLNSNTEPVISVDPTSGRVVGGASFAGSFGPGRYSVYTCVDFKGEGFDLGSPVEYGVYITDEPTQYSTTFTQLYSGFDSEMGALLGFSPSSDSSDGTTTILARVGVSFISTDQACSNAETDIPEWDFEGVVTNARDTWNELLGRIQVDTTGVDDEITELFYSSFYRTHLVPANYTGENPKWESTEPYYDSFYCNWDTFRNLYPLYSLHDPERFAEIVRGMINIQQHEGWLPECRGATVQQYIQGGSDADPILGEFFVKYHGQAASLGVSSDNLFQALLVDGENTSTIWNLQGRLNTAWKQYNFIPSDLYAPGGAATKQVSRTIESAFDDFAIAQVAKILNQTDIANEYYSRAGYYVNVWNENVTLPGDDTVKGMMQPRFMNGTFNYTDPRHCSVNDPTQATCYLDATNHDGFYESSPMVYSLFVPHDTAKLIELAGGNESFVHRLNVMFEQHFFDISDEPSMQIPFMYHYVNQPGLSVQQARETMADNFNTTVIGIPGNDDSGVMGSFAAFVLLGMYPVPATQQYLLVSPYFPQVSFYNPAFNSTTTIKATNFQGNPANGTGGTVYIQNVTVNGQPYKSNCYLDWDVFQSGSTVELTLTDDASVACGDTADALPPSLSTGGFA
ncbi:glycoside hydrolase family 92 protein [Coniophora puteana RWD-64-598 SS2]|uniref:Glycoside hydrolase family 92 protein n=1 Tax=Coniophora puteana (strain RWD-64-598) TaxID=741705 RepID=A0A5M3N533_CONPW|nr:glycoside hydrolase family 92 protein [Coniophora puteana RWD-64-598 SS2]EIW86530.1 glycoside hydrolase family 92 protein [Coniophora puteana RWD-64-598 SS2]